MTLHPDERCKKTDPEGRMTKRLMTEKCSLESQEIPIFLSSIYPSSIYPSSIVLSSIFLSSIFLSSIFPSSIFLSSIVLSLERNRDRLSVQASLAAFRPTRSQYRAESLGEDQQRTAAKIGNARDRTRLGYRPSPHRDDDHNNELSSNRKDASSVSSGDRRADAA